MPSSCIQSGAIQPPHLPLAVAARPPTPGSASRFQPPRWRCLWRRRLEGLKYSPRANPHSLSMTMRCHWLVAVARCPKLHLQAKSRFGSTTTSRPNLVKGNWLARAYLRGCSDLTWKNRQVRSLFHPNKSDRRRAGGSEQKLRWHAASPRGNCSQIWGSPFGMTGPWIRSFEQFSRIQKPTPKPEPPNAPCAPGIKECSPKCPRDLNQTQLLGGSAPLPHEVRKKQMREP